MKEKFKEIGDILGFESKLEFGIPKGHMDCVWRVREPVSEIFITFEFETATSGSQIIENLVKTLSLPPQMKPRFLIQIYRDKLTEKTKSYIEKIASTLPITTRIFEDVGIDVEEVSQKVIIELFNWISEQTEISDSLIKKMENIIPRDKIVRIFHYGEPNYSYLQYLDRALRQLRGYLMHIRSVPMEKNESYLPQLFQDLTEYDIVILSDVSLRYCDKNSVHRFIDEEVKKKGKILILTGGYGLTKDYNDLGEENLGGKIMSCLNRKVRIIRGIGQGLVFKGLNQFRATNREEIVSFWDIKDLPATIIHKIDKGKMIIFTSDCSPAWGTPTIQTEGFREMWKTILEKYCLIRI
ncbi:MAG: glutamine amidotransferase [Candidatus Caldarchaeales archaeon]